MRMRSRTWGVCYACGVIAVFLLAQLRVILPPGGLPRNWYWPFVDYPMYSGVHYRGEVMTSQELRAYGCEEPRTPRVVEWHQLRITPDVFGRMIGQSLVPRERVYHLDMPAEEFLLEMVAKHLRDVCVLEVWEVSTVLDRKRLTGEDAAWQMKKRWLLPDPADQPRS